MRSRIVPSRVSAGEAGPQAIKQLSQSPCSRSIHTLLAVPLMGRNAATIRDWEYIVSAILTCSSDSLQ